MDKIRYMSDMLTDKPCDYVKHGLNMLCLNPSDPSKWIFSDWESMMEHMQKHYKTIDTTQVAKNKLDTLTQGERNYWSWKAELDELMIKTNKTEEQKWICSRKMSPTRSETWSSPSATSSVMPTTMAGVSRWMCLPTTCRITPTKPN